MPILFINLKHAFGTNVVRAAQVASYAMFCLVDVFNKSKLRTSGRGWKNWWALTLYFITKKIDLGFFINKKFFP